MAFLDKIRQMFSTDIRDAELQKQIEELKERTPVPVFWLFGKTQSGKTSLIKYLTSAEDAEIGSGFKPCTKYSRQYEFPTSDAPLLTFLDTRGIAEPGYAPDEDIARFDELAHVVIVTAKVMDHAQEDVVQHLRTIRNSKPDRPIVLALTCLNEAFPQQQHPTPYEQMNWEPETEDKSDAMLLDLPDDLKNSLIEQRKRFADLVDYIVPIDLTKPEDGYENSEYGGQRLKDVLQEALPRAYRQTLITLEDATHDLSDIYARHALPHIVGYSTLAGTAGAFPIPWLDLLVIPAIQSRMIYHLAEFYGQPMTGERFLELAGTLGMGMMVRQAAREVVKFVPVVGSMAGAALAGAATFALGKAFCYYYSAVHRGHVPQPEEIRKYYKEQLAKAEQAWKKRAAKTPEEK